MFLDRFYKPSFCLIYSDRNGFLSEFEDIAKEDQVQRKNCFDLLSCKLPLFLFRHLTKIHLLTKVPNGKMRHFYKIMLFELLFIM